ncbi:hypothetical protein RPQ02_40700 [Streptomyces sp. AM2-3-1]|uniref:hypothetical protein n=1 Tax=Streptomyces sp. AM2-3-1 TaxID=3075824 RepID=UPI0028C3E389|nr:hypothetical protein [Streptomyces sp. AM2-3-1]WNO62325.1 hypothetical protein RPQ02_00075 [Streptomyces sp. AM2-3-1]WNO69621.1 hypothetical protein RPQ02_40700 [Streptomyces sp. AM2-3-1]
MLQHPLDDKRAAIVSALLTVTNERLRTEADLEGAEVIAEVRRVRPAWLRSMPDSGKEAMWRTKWTKKVWRAAAEQHAHFRGTPQARSTERMISTLVKEQKEQRQALLEAKFDLGDLSSLVAMPTAETDPAIRTGWREGDKVEAWRVEAQETYWRACLVARRAAITREDSTTADWVGTRVDLGKACESRLEFNRFWLYEVDRANMPRNWLRWAAGMVQASMKVTRGNPVDVQHTSYLPDCEVFLTADKNFARVLRHVAEAAPVTVGRVQRIEAPTSVGDDVIEAIEAALIS